MELKGARLKIERARKHIADIEARVAALSDSDVATIEINPAGGNEVIKHDLTDRAAATDLALMTGDAVHNLKCALDHAWHRTIEKLAPSAVTKFAKFPVYPSRNELETALKGRKIDVVSPKLFRLMLTKIKPYEGGDDAIWPIHRLDILDKHRVLLPVIGYASINDIETENERGGWERRSSRGTWQLPPWYIHIPPGWHVKSTGKPSLTVLFAEETPTRHFDVTGTLRYFSATILQVVELLEKVGLTFGHIGGDSMEPESAQSP